MNKTYFQQVTEQKSTMFLINNPTSEKAQNWFEFTDYVIDRCSWDWMSATDLIVMIPVFILSMTIRKHFVQGMTMEAVK